MKEILAWFMTVLALVAIIFVLPAAFGHTTTIGEAFLMMLGAGGLFAVLVASGYSAPVVRDRFWTLLGWATILVGVPATAIIIAFEIMHSPVFWR